MKTAIIDYGMSNMGSIRRSLEECGADAYIAEEPEDLKLATHIILPGVGAFGDGMDNLNKAGWNEAIEELVVRRGVPLLGICLGMQLLAEWGNEGGRNRGLGLIPGEVCRLKPTTEQERIPHVGWNEVYQTRTTPLLQGIAEGSDFYFVHSYHFATAEASHAVARTPYCASFVSIVQRENIFGTQFHPEKSGRFGFQILKNFLHYLKAEG